MNNFAALVRQRRTVMSTTACVWPQTMFLQTDDSARQRRASSLNPVRAQRSVPPPERRVARAAGVLGGAPVGAAGAIVGRAGTGAAVGAAGAGAAGVTRGLIHGVTSRPKPSPTYKNFVNRC